MKQSSLWMLPAPFSPRTIDLHNKREALPLVYLFPAGFSLPRAFERLQSIPGVLWLDSVTHPSPTLGRYSFLTADPIERITDPNPEVLAKKVRELPDRNIAELPPFQGGIAGIFAYEWGRQFEELPSVISNDLDTPPISLGIYDWTIAQDHLTGQSWIVSQGLGADNEGRAMRLAKDRIEQVLQWLDAPAWPSPLSSQGEVRTTDLARQFPTYRHPLLTSNFSPEGFRSAVEEIVTSIRRGDFFQVNLAQRLLFPASGSAAELYRRLRRENPAPEAGYYDGGSFKVLSSSPETFLRMRHGQIETRPIKGTCRRSGDSELDAIAASELAASTKDCAENVMIVDLMRNDLARVCEDSSVQVTQLCEVEPYAFVQHLVSVITGQLRPDKSTVDLLAACFPGGSITGAPKVEAMKKIAELERVPRGPYCGSMGYLGCGGTVGLNILIRTLTQCHGYWQIPVGGGITAASDPIAEERETWHKAEGLLRALPI